MTINIPNLLLSSAELKTKLAKDPQFVTQIEKAITYFRECVHAGGTIYMCGNGGSACDAMHFAEELVARYKKERPGIRARHLLDPGVMSCWANDYNYDTVFSRQIETLANERDLLVAISTSGNSPSITNAITAAKKVGCPTVALLGKGGGKAKDMGELSLIVPSNDTERIQEVHITLIHIFCEALESDYK